MLIEAPDKLTTMSIWNVHLSGVITNGLDIYTAIRVT